MIDKIKTYGISLWEIIGIIAAACIIFILILPLFRRVDKRRPVTCTSNQYQISACLQMYAQDHDFKLPVSQTMWNDIQIDANVLICPQDKKTPNGYLYNNNCSGLSLGEIKKSDKIMMTIDGETTTGPNRSIDHIYYTPADVIFRHYEKDKNMYWAVASFVDGHTELINKVTEPESWDMPINKHKAGGTK